MRFSSPIRLEVHHALYLASSSSVFATYASLAASEDMPFFDSQESHLAFPLKSNIPGRAEHGNRILKYFMWKIQNKTNQR